MTFKKKRRDLFDEKERFIEVLPSGALLPTIVYGMAEEHRRAGRQVCDCCMQPGDRFVFLDQRGFGIHPERVEYEQGEWAFCVFCWALFKRREIDLLTARSMTLNPELPKETVAQLYAMLPYVTHGKPRVEGDILESEV